jgi:selenocysteine lyase/cysteine desulfurase
MPTLIIVYKQKKIYISGATAVQRQQIQLTSQDLVSHMNELAITVVRIIFTY